MLRRDTFSLPAFLPSNLPDFPDGVHSDVPADRLLPETARDPNTRWTKPGWKWYFIHVFQSARMSSCRLSVI